MGTGKKTIRDDSPTTLSAGRAERNAPQRTAVIPRTRRSLTRSERVRTVRS
jgi:hypothetical protein